MEERGRLVEGSEPTKSFTGAIEKTFKSSSCSSSNPDLTYDVFLSFRGEDTRKKITDHLYAALDREGIFTFRDDEELETGKLISANLRQAIENSRIALVVFSSNYASSTWCLDELVKIFDCMKQMGQTVFPIFYDVEPSEVRKQTGSFKVYFDAHEERFKDSIEKVQKWRESLTEIANLRGFHLQDRYESKFIQDIVENIVSGLNRTHPSVSRNFVGIGSRVQDILKLCSGIKKKNDVGFIGIWGIGGIGKTTLARCFVDKISPQFDAISFLDNVKEVSAERDGLVTLQEKLLSQVQMRKVKKIWDFHKGISEIKHRLCHKKVLIILDDVDTLRQLEALAGSHFWFGRESRIIITTRDEHLLIAHGVDELYEAKTLNEDEALKLFSRKAFKNGNHDDHVEKYKELSHKFLQYANGLPLVIENMGRFLCGRNIAEWESAYARDEGNIDNEIMNMNKRFL